jgi:hypothetical protein
LQKGGWLIRVGQKPGGGTLWQLRVPDDQRTDRNGKNCFATSRNFLPFRSAKHDVWFYGHGLGKTRLRIYEALSIDTEIAAKNLALQLGYRDPRPVRKHLASLANYGLALRRPDGRWLRGNRPLDEVAKRLGVNGKGEELRRRRQEAREEYGITSAIRPARAS